jgi:hypothetical protein
MKVGDLVRETIDGHTGVIVEWAQNGWLVHFPEYNCVFHMKPRFLEKVV